MVFKTNYIACMIDSKNMGFEFFLLIFIFYRKKIAAFVHIDYCNYIYI